MFSKGIPGKFCLKAITHGAHCEKVKLSFEATSEKAEK